MEAESLGGDEVRGRHGWGTMLFLASGYALCRTCSELPLGLAGFEASWEEAGKVAGLLAVLTWIVVRLRVATPRALNRLPDLCLAAGCALSAALPLFDNAVAGAVAGLLVGMGASASMVLWLEAFGTLPSRRIVVCLALAYVLDVPVGLFSMALRATVAVPAIMCLAAAVAIGMRHVRGRVPGVCNVELAFPRVVNGLDALVPGVVVAWVLASGFSFGIMEAGSLGSVAGSALDVVGRCVPSAMVVAVYLLAPERFDLRWLYAITLPLLLAGLSLAGSSGPGNEGAALLFCMGATAARLVAYFAVCSAAAWRGLSSLFGCTCVMLLNVVARNAGVFVSATPAFATLGELFYTLAVVVTSATVVVFLMVELGDTPHGRSFDVQASAAACEPDVESEAERFARIASSRGLSPREADVFVHMMAGETTARIGDELFISAGAVRSHTSRIYEKFGVHSRQELEQVVTEL